MTFDQIETILEENEIRIIGDLQDRYVDLEFFSPLGEDFIMSIDFDGTPKDFVVQFLNYCADFDPDEHAAFWIENRGKNGTPFSVRALVDDAEAIDDFLLDVMQQLATLP